jgi:hypothetical protein
MTPQPVALSFGTGQGVMDFDTSYLKSYLESQKK